MTPTRGGLMKMTTYADVMPSSSPITLGVCTISDDHGKPCIAGHQKGEGRGALARVSTRAG